MTDSTSSLLAILFGLGVFAIIVAIGWRSVQHRRILRLQDANGHETIIVASEDDDVSSIATTATATTETVQQAPAAGFGRNVARSETAADVRTGPSERDRLS